jgi:hypothetical protein
MQQRKPALRLTLVARSPWPMTLVGIACGNQGELPARIAK